jgi:hypothetical protein
MPGTDDTGWSVEGTVHWNVQVSSSTNSLTFRKSIIAVLKAEEEEADSCKTSINSTKLHGVTSKKTAPYFHSPDSLESHSAR